MVDVPDRWSSVWLHARRALILTLALAPLSVGSAAAASPPRQPYADSVGAGAAAFTPLAAQTASVLLTPQPLLADTETYDAFGVLGRLPNGTLRYVYRRAIDHVGSAGTLMSRTSADNGETWSAPTTMLAEPGVDLRVGSGGVTQTGRFVLVDGRYDTRTRTYLSIVSRYSDDGGATWSTGTTLPTTGTTAFLPNGSVVQTADGELLTSWYGDDGTTFDVFVVKSSDDGAHMGTEDRGHQRAGRRQREQQVHRGVLHRRWKPHGDRPGPRRQRNRLHAGQEHR